MKTKFIYSLFVLLISVFIISCEDFIEVDLGKKTITVLAPANNSNSPSFNQLFKWEDLKGAEKYQLQIVKPTFAAIQQFVLDTTTALSQFSFTLSPGAYQWRLRALNNSSETEYQTFTLTIDSTLDLSSSTVGSVSPINNYYSKFFTNTFSWGSLPNVDNYVLQTFGATNSIQSITTTTAIQTFAAEGIYTWKIYAQNGFSTSLFTTQTITIDTTRPDVPVYVSPSSDTLTANPILLEWNSSATADYSQVQISTDSLFTTASFVDVTIPITGIPITYNFSTSVIGVTYYWRVRDLDFAGNKSNFFYRKRIKRI
jgi:hypothetical protein